jgi:putative ABC transport system permease protein
VLSVMALRQPDASQQLDQAQFVLLAFMVATALLGPYLRSLTEVMLRRPLGALVGTAGRLAGAELRARARRTAAAVVAIALPVCFAGAIIIVDATQAHGAAVQGGRRLAANLVVSAPGPGLSPSAVAAVRSIPAVTGALGLAPTSVYVPVSGVGDASGMAVTSGPLTSLLQLGVISGTLTGFHTGDVPLSTLMADQGAMNVRVGQTVTVYLADGAPYRARVTAVFSRSLGFADVLVPTGAAGGGHLGTNLISEVVVGDARTRPSATGGGTAALVTGGGTAARVQDLSSSYTGLHVVDRGVFNAQYDELTSQDSYINNFLLALVGLLAAVALVNTLVVSTLQGGEEMRLLRQVGATVRQVLAVVVCRTATVIAVGTVLGAAAQAAALIAVTKALSGSWVPSFPAGPLAVAAGIGGDPDRHRNAGTNGPHAPSRRAQLVLAPVIRRAGRSHCCQHQAPPGRAQLVL